MALMLEIRDVRGHATWHALDRLPLTLGRALSNDIIIDDPYVDGVHARISLDDDGTVAIEDAGTVNGIVVHEARTAGPIRLAAGVQLRLGQTSLAVRARNEAVPAALPYTAEAASPELALAAAASVSTSDGDSSARTRWARWSEWALETTRGRVVVVSAMLAAMAVTSTLGHTEKSLAMDVFMAVLVTAIALLIWASIWAIATRGASRRLHVAGHLAVAALVGLVLLIYGVAEEWLRFMFPDAGILDVLSWASMAGLLAWLVAAHLGVSRQVARQRRWRVGLITSGVVVVLFGVGALLGDDEFSDVPKFSQQLKRLPAALIPSESPEEFLRVMQDVKSRADEAAAVTEPSR